MKLSEFQNLFSQTLLSPGAPILAAQFPLAHDKEDAVDRISIYRNNVFSGLIDALSDLYPTIQKLLGEPTFNSIARKYFSQNPPTEAAMVNLAQDFPAYLVQHPVHESLPYIQDVALLDLFYHQAYYADDAVALAPEDFMALPPDELAEKRIKLHPACTFLSSRFSIFDIWQLHYADDAPDTVDMNQAQNIILTRPAHTVELLKVDKPVSIFLRQLKKNSKLGAAMSRVMNEDISAAFLMQFLIEHQLVIELN